MSMDQTWPHFSPPAAASGPKSPLPAFQVTLHGLDSPGVFWVLSLPCSLDLAIGENETHSENKV